MSAGAVANRDSRLTAIAGLLGVLAGAAGFFVDRMWTIPATDATAAQLVEFATDNRPALLVAMLLNTMGVTFWLLFGTGVWVHLRRNAPDELLRTTWFGVGLVVFVALLLAGFTCLFVLVYRAPAARDPLLLYDLTFALLAMSGAPTAIALWAYADIVHRTRLLAPSTAVLAWVGAAAHVALFSSLVVREGFWSLEGPVIIVIPGTLFAWIAATSVALLRAPSRAPSAA